ncbi:hypothetical protein PN462_18780 [Spirulina sp. CS-785/01]|uniref:Tic20 family protein n=1 Tax=Spirulina sp. CS-785/01 TaxID=3021716 RepID=UPI0023303BBD|nr:Tic20 family protein [Spirulina sp. CS-785/01]MDB9315167.1 hypothetical protein [Spirulina sp. CS-785/01]
MVWRGDTTLRDRILGALPYLMPMLDILLVISSIPAGFILFSLFPPLRLLLSPLYAILPFYTMRLGGFLSVELILFIVLFVAVVRNDDLPRFLRFNTLQGLLMSIFLFLCNLVLDLIGRMLFVGALQLVLQGVFVLLFIGTMAASIFAIIQCFRGLYADIPFISEAAHSQLP